MTDPVSWWLKFDRAQNHREEAEAMVAAATYEQEIRIEKTESDIGKWLYTVHHDASIDRSFPAVVGDFLFNLRSALDHIAAANRLRPTLKSPFPLFHDPIGGPTLPGEPPRYRAYRRVWAQIGANTPPAVFAAMTAAQPYNAPNGLVPADTALAVLNELQNRDKHANLAVVTSGIKDIQCWVETPDGQRAIRDPGLPPGMFPNGANIFSLEHDIEIRARGRVALAIAAGPTAGYRPLPESFGDMVGDVATLLKSIEAVM